MAEVKWIKLSTDIFDNRKIRQIENMPEGDAMIVIWLKLLILAGQVNDGGCVYFTKDIPYTEQLLATQFNRPISIIQLALSTFQKFGMIELYDDVIMVSNWEKYQNIEGMEKIREQTRKRVAKYREKQALLEGNKACNVTVTHCNATEEDKEKEREEDQEREKKKSTPAAAIDQIITDLDASEELKQTIRDFVAMRKTIRAPITDRGLSMMLTKLFQMGANDETRIAILSQSVMNSWKGIFPLHNEAQGKNKAEQRERETVDMLQDWMNSRKGAE